MGSWGEPYDWKTKTWACDQLKANNWSVENFEKHVTWVGPWACDTVMWRWSAATLFWQLSIDHSMNVYYQVKHRLQAPTPARKIDISHWFPCGADGQAHVRWRDYTIISRMDRLPDFLRHGAPLALASRARGASLSMFPKQTRNRPKDRASSEIGTLFRAMLEVYRFQD